MNISSILNIITVGNAIKDYAKANLPTILDFFSAPTLKNISLDEYLDIRLLNHNIYINRLIQNIGIPNISKLNSIIDIHKTTLEHFINYKNDATAMKKVYKNYNQVGLEYTKLSKEQKALYKSKEEYIHGLLLLKGEMIDESALKGVKEHKSLLNYFSQLKSDSSTIDIAEHINKNHALINTYASSYGKNLTLLNKEIIDTIIYPIITSILDGYSLKYTKNHLAEIKNYLNNTYCIVDGFSNLEVLCSDAKNKSLTPIAADLFAMEALNFSNMVSSAENLNSLSYTPYNKLSKLLQSLYRDEKSYSYYIKLRASLNNITNTPANNNGYIASIKNAFSSVYGEIKEVTARMLPHAAPYIAVAAGAAIAYYLYNRHAWQKKEYQKTVNLKFLTKHQENAKKLLQEVKEKIEKNPNVQDLETEEDKLNKILEDIEDKKKYQISSKEDRLEKREDKASSGSNFFTRPLRKVFHGLNDIHSTEKKLKEIEKELTTITENIKNINATDEKIVTLSGNNLTNQGQMKEIKEPLNKASIHPLKTKKIEAVIKEAETKIEETEGRVARWDLFETLQKEINSYVISIDKLLNGQDKGKLILSGNKSDNKTRKELEKEKEKLIEINNKLYEKKQVQEEKLTGIDRDKELWEYYNNPNNCKNETKDADKLISNFKKIYENLK